MLSTIVAIRISRLGCALAIRVSLMFCICSSTTLCFIVLLLWFVIQTLLARDLCFVTNLCGLFSISFGSRFAFVFCVSIWSEKFVCALLWVAFSFHDWVCKPRNELSFRWREDPWKNHHQSHMMMVTVANTPRWKNLLQREIARNARDSPKMFVCGSRSRKSFQDQLGGRRQIENVLIHWWKSCKWTQESMETCLLCQVFGKIDYFPTIWEIESCFQVNLCDKHHVASK